METIKQLILVIILMATIFSSGCGLNSNEERILSDAQWVEDIDCLDNNLRDYHSDLFRFISEDEWEENIEKLKTDVKDLSDVHIKLRIAQIISSVGDSHTDMLHSELLSPLPSPILRGANQTEIEGVIEFPIKCEYFDDGLRVVSCDSTYKEILGYKLISINDTSVESVINEISTIIGHDYGNEQKGLECAKEYLNVYEILEFFNIVDNNKAEYVFENDSNEKIHLSLKAIKNENIDYISVNRKDTKTSLMPEGKSEYYWYKGFEEEMKF